MQFLTYNGNGPFTGAYIQDSAPTGVSYIEVDDADYANWVNLSYQDGAIVPTPGPTAAQQLATAQATQIAALTAAYQAAIQQSVSYTTVGGVNKVFQADDYSQNVLLIATTGYNLAGATPAGFYWVSSDNTQVPFALADLKGLYGVMLVQGNTAYQQLQTLKAQVNAVVVAQANAVAAVQAIVW